MSPLRPRAGDEWKTRVVTTETECRDAAEALVGQVVARVTYVGLTYDDLDEPVSWDYGDWHWPEVGVELATTGGPVLRHLGLQGDAF